MRKSILKRFRITKTGKFMRRACGQDHNLAKKSGEAIRKGRKQRLLSSGELKRIKRALND